MLETPVAWKIGDFPVSLGAAPLCMFISILLPGFDTPGSTSGNEPEEPGEAPWTEAPEILAAPCEILLVNITTLYILKRSYTSQNFSLIQKEDEVFTSQQNTYTNKNGRRDLAFSSA